MNHVKVKDSDCGHAEEVEKGVAGLTGSVNDFTIDSSSGDVEMVLFLQVLATTNVRRSCPLLTKSSETEKEMI